MILDKHEYMIWRAVTKYDLLHDESSGATEENVEEMVNEKENKITDLIPSFFDGKNKLDESENDLEEKGVCIKKCKTLRHTNSFIASREDGSRWSNIELLCYVTGTTSYYYAPFKWCRYPLMSYYEAIKVIYDYDFGEDFIKPKLSDYKTIKECLPKLGLYTYNQLKIISLFDHIHYQITPSGEKVHTYLFVGNDFLKYINLNKGGDKNE